MRGRPLRALVVPLVLALLAVAALRDFSRLGDALPWHQLYDFSDFYCAGAALDEGADPYRYEPLHGCEHRVNRTEAYRRDPARAIPAPLPPYDFPPFALAARLSFSAARAVDAVAIVTAIAAAAFGLGLVGIPLDVAALALALPAGFLLLAAGQVVPFALLALVYAGVALARRRDRAAGILAALTLIEPHLGLPVCVAMLLFAPRSRLALLVTGALLACAAVATAGIHGVVEYVLLVVPAQAAAEAGYVYQYSLTYLLRTGGVPASAALALGDLSYAAMLVASLLLAARLQQHLGRRELLAYVPGALSLVGGPYVHMVDLAVAIPAALVLATRLAGRSKNLATVAVVLLAVPWIDVWIVKKLFLSTLFVVAALLVRLQAGTALSLGTFAAVAAFMYWLELWPPAGLTATTAGSFAANGLVQQAWRAYVAQIRGASALWAIVKVPTWAAFAALIAASLRAITTGRRGPAP